MRVLRIDAGTLAPPQRMPNGWLRCEGKLARVGIQEYERTGGGITRELRIPEEVFRKATMDSFHLIPITATHPPILLDAANAISYTKGSVGEVRQDGDWIVGPLMIIDAPTVGRVESGELAQLSTGYSCELDDTQIPELIAKWGPYDTIQRNILANHEALVSEARAGPEARVRLDSAGNAEHKKEHAMLIHIDGLPYELTDANKGAIEAAIDRSKQAIKTKLDEAISANDTISKRHKIVLDNGKILVKRVRSIHKAFDAMKAKMIPCDECQGSGKVASADDDGSSDEPMMSKCDMCDGTGTIRMHMPISKATGIEEGNTDEEGDEDEPDEGDLDEEMGDPDEEMDETELEVAQETEQKAGESKADAIARRNRRDAARKLAKKRSDSIARRIDRAVKVRRTLEVVAGQILGTDVSKMDSTEIKKKVVTKLSPTSKLDGISSARLALKFDTLVEVANVPRMQPADIARGGSSPFLQGNRRDNKEEPREDGSHLSGRARMLFDLHNRNNNQ